MSVAIKDDRSAAAVSERWPIVLGKDSFLSGWGEAEGKTSYAGWACPPEAVDAVERWVRSRSEMKRVRVVAWDYSPKGTNMVLHIYQTKKGIQY